ncbi:hypothetical protein [Thermococcus thioreducens]|uniref:hypothetical protein n=2 Tax=Thermococcus thioreducens TaxID=277988 RepID=UPI000942C7A2|nr:hypothetical protein [Thermococcus thioreducens]
MTSHTSRTPSQTKRAYQKKIRGDPWKPEHRHKNKRVRDKRGPNTHWYFDYYGKKYIHKSLEDAQKWNTLVGLMTILPAMFHKLTDTKELGKRTDAMLEKIAEGLIFYNHRKEVEEEYGTLKIPPPKEAVLSEGYLLPEFEKLKKDPQFQDKFLDALAEAYHLRIWPKERLRDYLKLAIDAAEEVSSYLGKDGKVHIPAEEFEKFEKLNKFLDTLFTKEFHARKRPQKPPAEMGGKKVEPKFGLAVSDTSAGEQRGRYKWTDQAKNLKSEATRLLGIVQSLKLLNAGEEELKKVEDELWKAIKETQNLELAGLYAKLITYLRGKDPEGAEGFLAFIVEEYR